MNDNYMRANGRYIFFNSKNRDSRKRAWEAAMRASADPKQVWVFRAFDSGRYPGECRGEPHPVVGEGLEPISPRCRVIGYRFDSGGQEMAEA